MTPFRTASLGTFQDANVFYEEFLTFIEQVPASPISVYAVATIDYEIEIGGGESLQESAVFNMKASPLEGSPEVWWRNNVLYPVKRLLDRYLVGDVVNIGYVWE